MSSIRWPSPRNLLPGFGAAASRRVRRWARARQGIDALLLSVGADLPYFTGYAAMPLERLTMAVIPRDGDATLVVPELEAPRVERHDEVFEVLAWGETENPIEIGLVLTWGSVPPGGATTRSTPLSLTHNIAARPRSAVIASTNSTRAPESPTAY